MVIELIVIGAAIAGAVVALVASPMVRAICSESLIHPRDRCQLEKYDNGVRVVKTASPQAEEG